MLINTLLQRGGEPKRVSPTALAVSGRQKKTAKAVANMPVSPDTSLKRGVNEIRLGRIRKSVD